MLCKSPRDTAAIPFSPAGGPSDGQPITVPSFLSARLLFPKAEIAATFVAAAGTLTLGDQPQATTVPLFLSATACWAPAAMPMTPSSPAGTFVFPYALSPHAMTVPSANAEEKLTEVPKTQSTTSVFARIEVPILPQTKAEAMLDRTVSEI